MKKLRPLSEMKINLAKVQKLNEVSSEEKDIIQYFKDYDVEITPKFKLADFAKFIGFTVSDATTLLVNMEDDKVMKDIAIGNYKTFDTDDRSQFNDSYEDMIEDLGI